MSADAQQPADLLQSGWAALATGAWQDAYAAFTAANEQDHSAEAMEGLGFAAWWLNRVSTALGARIVAYRLYLERHDRRGAARVAVWLSMDYFTIRGEGAIANGCVQRAYRLLDGLEPGPEHALVASWDAHMAMMIEHDTVRAKRLYSEGAALARSLGAVDLEMLARAGEGFARVCEGEVVAGMRLLDETPPRSSPAR